jgi:CHAT domain-containing protein/Tfp pilus assembly protein PilF
MVMRILNRKTLTILYYLFSYSFAFGQNPEPIAKDLYQDMVEVWRNLKDGHTVEALKMSQLTLKKYQTYRFADRYLGYLWSYQGEAFFRLGDLGLARSCYLLGINQAIEQKNRSLEVDLRINLAATYHEAHNYTACLDHSREIYFNKTLHLSAEQQSILLSNMAVSCSNINDFDGADSLFRILFRTIKMKGGTGEFDTLLTYRNYGSYLNKKGLPANAKPYLVMALKGYQNKLGDSHYQTSNSWIYLGQCFEKLNLPDSALICFNHAIGALAPKAKQNAPLNFEYQQVNYETIYLEALVSKGSLLQQIAKNQFGTPKIENLTQAFENYQEAANRMDQLMHSYLYTESGFILADKGRKIFDGGIQTAIQIGELTQQEGYFDKAFMWAIESKSISFYTSALQNMNTPADHNQVNLHVEYYSVRASIEQTRHSLEKNPLSALADSLGLLTTRFTELHQTIQSSLNYDRAFPSELQLLKTYKPANFRTRTYLGFHDLDSCFLIFGVNRNQRFYKLIPKSSDMTDSISKINQYLSQPLNGHFSNDQVSSFIAVSNFLYQKLIKPVEKSIKGRSLLIHPDGILLGFPFDILLTNDPLRGRKYDSNSFKNLPYLSNNHTISYISIPLRELSHNSWIADSDSMAVVIDRSDPALKSIQNEVHLLMREFKSFRFIHEDSIRLLLETLEHIPVLHFAGHVTRDSVDPYQSKIIQSLDWGTILGCKFQNKLVFINGCESGQGPRNKGEGLLSPGFAFALAGTPSVIENLWVASDKASSELAAYFYRHSFSMEVPGALQSAKEEYLANCSAGMSHPHYWAGMICYQSLPDEAHIPWAILITSGIAIIIVLLGFLIIRRRNCPLIKHP